MRGCINAWSLSDAVWLSAIIMQWCLPDLRQHMGNFDSSLCAAARSGEARLNPKRNSNAMASTLRNGSSKAP